MKSVEDVFKEVVEDTDIEQFDKSVKDELIGKLREALAAAVLEGRQILRESWQDADKRDSIGEYHIMVAKRIEKRANEIREGK